MRGGVSKTLPDRRVHPVSSPRAWGCFCHHHIGAYIMLVFPTCVGVFLYLVPSPLPAQSLPHVRGGVSRTFENFRTEEPSSPRAWGCFPKIRALIGDGYVFPTCVGVFLSGAIIMVFGLRLPHVRGGVSAVVHDLCLLLLSSPRAWGCFYSSFSLAQKFLVFPTCVGVFLLLSASRCFEVCLPHVRGGVSFSQAGRYGSGASSPRAWGCFPHVL